MELSFESKDRFAVVRFEAPDLNRPFLQELWTVMQTLEASSHLQAVIFTGHRNIFMTGACLKEIVSLKSRAAALEFLELPHALVKMFCTSKKLLIAAINGYCLGGGLELALACDFRIMVDKIKTIGGEVAAYMGFPEVQLGLIPAVGGAYLATELLGLEKANELLLTADPIDAAKAMGIGLVRSVVMRKNLMAQAEILAEHILAHSWPAVAATKELLNRGRLSGLEPALRATALAFAECCERGDLADRIAWANRQERNRLRSQVQLNTSGSQSLVGAPS